MSPSWRDRLAVSLAPDGVAAVRFGRGLFPRAIRQTFIPCPAGVAGWQAPVQALDELLSREDWQDADMRVALSNEYVRYAVVTLDPALKRAREREAYIRLQIEKRFGSLAADWELRNTPSPDGRVVVSAIERKLLDAIGQAAAARVRWISLQPYLMAAFNRIRHEIGSDPAALLVAEPGRMLLAVFAGGDWHAIGNRRVERNDAVAAARLVDEELILHGLRAGTVWCEGLDELPAGAGDRAWRHCPPPPRLEGVAPQSYSVALQGLAWP